MSFIKLVQGRCLSKLLPDVNYKTCPRKGSSKSHQIFSQGSRLKILFKIPGSRLLSFNLGKSYSKTPPRGVSFQSSIQSCSKTPAICRLLHRLPKFRPNLASKPPFRDVVLLNLLHLCLPKLRPVMLSSKSSSKGYFAKNTFFGQKETQKNWENLCSTALRIQAYWTCKGFWIIKSTHPVST